MRLKKTLVCTLAVTLVTSMLLTGCSGEKKTLTKSAIPLSAENEFPLTEQKVELNIFVPKQSFIENFETNEFTKYYEELTNVKINWEVASGDTTQALNLKLAGGDYPDIFYGFNFSKEQMNIYGAQQGIFTDISGIIDEYGHYIKEMFESRPDIKEDLMIDGAIYGLPRVEESPYSIYKNNLWVYKPWLDKLGKDVPTTTDELYDLLVLFRDSDLNGNGQKDEIPLVARGVSGNAGIEPYIMNSFVSVGDNRLSFKNGKVSFTANTDEYREGLRFIKKLYKEGLLYQDTFVIDRTRITSLGENDVPILGAGTGLWAGYFTINGAVSGRIKDYISVPPLKGPNGFRQSVSSGTDYSTAQFLISNKCKYPELAIKWVDWFYNEENRIKSYGKEGFRKAVDGEIGIDGQPALWAQDVLEAGETAGVGALQNKAWTNFGVFYKPLETDLRTAIYDDYARKVAENRYEAYQQHIEVGVDINLPPLLMSSEDTTKVADYCTNINNLVDNAFAEFVKGVRNIDDDKQWNAYVKSLEDAGLNDYLKVIKKYVEK